MRDGQGRGGKGDLHAVPRSAFCRPHTEGLWLLGAHPHAAGARCCPATPRLSPRAHPSGSPQGPPAAQLGPLACISLGHSLSPGARTLNPCSATVTRPQKSTSNFLANVSSNSDGQWSSSWRAIFPAWRMELMISGTCEERKVRYLGCAVAAHTPAHKV